MSDPVAMPDNVVSIAQAAQSHALGPLNDADIRRELDAMRMLMQAVMISTCAALPAAEAREL